MKELTVRQREVYEWVSAYVRENGYAPTYAEIARGIGCRNQSTVWELLTALQNKGYIDMGDAGNSPRKLRVK